MKLIPLGLGATAIALISIAAAAQGPGGGPGGNMGGGWGKGDPAQRHEMMVEKMFDRFDANGDGTITPEEREAARTERFEAGDTDSDGAISYDEFRTKRLERAEKRWKRGFERADANNDGKITADEQSKMGNRMRDRHLDRVDANGDGNITKEEALNAPPPKHRMGKGRGDCAQSPAPAQ